MITLADKGGMGGRRNADIGGQRGEGWGWTPLIFGITYEPCIRLIKFDMIAFCSYLE